MTQDWRIETQASDYLGNQKKRTEIEQRRPTIRKASDLVGPGIGASATRITDFNDLLATFNGYYSAAAGASNAPNTTEAFIGQVVSDTEIGGRQEFTGMTSGGRYSRTFTRSPLDPESIEWGLWSGGQRIPPSASGFNVFRTTVLNNATTVLLPPALTSVGEVGIYDPTTVGIFLRKQGVYTGNIRVGCDSAVGAAVTIQQPLGSTSVSNGYGGVLLGPSLSIPFTVWALDISQGFSVSVYQTSGAAVDCWWQFQCTRVGDAV